MRKKISIKKEEMPANLGSDSAARNSCPIDLDPTTNYKLHQDLWKQLLKRIATQMERYANEIIFLFVMQMTFYQKKGLKKGQRCVFS